VNKVGVLFSVINVFTINGTILHNGCTIKVQMVFGCIMKNGIMASNPEIDLMDVSAFFVSCQYRNCNGPAACPWRPITCMKNSLFQNKF
jgi:hypothetical protein